MILFLDFDGVLHPSRGSVPVFTRVPLLARWLAGWPGVDIVISSSWREVHSQIAMVGLLGPEVGDRVIGCTPLLAIERLLGRQGWARGSNKRGHEREQEVLAWLEASWQPRRPWVALDDLPELFEPGCAQLVVCDGRTGLTEYSLLQLDAHARRAGLVPCPVAPRERISVAEAAKRWRLPMVTYETIVEVVGAIPELAHIYVENAVGTRFTVDRDTIGRGSLAQGSKYLALVNEEGYALSVVRLPE